MAKGKKESYSTTGSHKYSYKAWVFKGVFNFTAEAIASGFIAVVVVVVSP